MSPNRENTAIAAAVLAVLVVATAVFYGYYSTLSQGTQGPVIGNLQLRSTAVEVTGLKVTDLSLNLKAVVYNPNTFGATLDTASYSVYADGLYLGSGQTAHDYEVAPDSSQTLNFPISVEWEPAFRTLGSYIAGGGQVTWEVHGTASVDVGGLPISTSFEFTTG